MAGYTVTVIGLGKVGFPLACYLAGLGHTVIGYDSKREVVDYLNSSENPMPWEPGVKASSLKLITSSLTVATASSESFFIAVPTPVERHNYLSGEIVERILRDLARLAPTKLRIIMSTLDPRTAAHVCSGRLTVYAPPLVRLGSVIEDLTRPPLLMVGGIDSVLMQQATDLLHNGFPQFGVVHSDPTTIALAKLAINVTLSAKAAWANEVAELAQRLGAKSEVVADILGLDPRIGPAFMQPGWPPSGPCLPRDLVAWCSLYRKAALPYSLALAVRASHARIKEICLGDLISQITDLSKGSQPKVGVIGLNYRQGVPSSEGTIAHELINLGRPRGWHILGEDLGPGTQAFVDSCSIIVLASGEVPDDIDFKGKDVIVVRPKV